MELTLQQVGDLLPDLVFYEMGLVGIVANTLINWPTIKDRPSSKRRGKLLLLSIPTTLVVMFLARVLVGSIIELRSYSLAISDVIAIWIMTRWIISTIWNQLTGKPTLRTATNKLVAAPPATAHASVMAPSRPAQQFRLEMDPAKPEVMAKDRANFHIFWKEAFLVNIMGYISTENAARIVSELHRAAMFDKVIVNICSNGGEVRAAQSILAAIHLLRADKNRDVRVMAAGECHSSAIGILLAVPAESRYCSLQTRLVLHSANSSDEEEIAWINKRFFEEPIVMSTRVTASSVKALLDSRQNFIFTAEEAMRLGYFGKGGLL